MSRVRAEVGRRVAQFLTSERRRDLRRSLRSLERRVTRRSPTVHYFHQFDDPYSTLAASQLERLTSRYAIRIECHAVPPPDLAAAPEFTALRKWSERDAAALASRFGLGAPENHAELADLTETPETIERGGALRERLGHYLGAMFYFEGEWYWGIDRLHHLEARLRQSGLAETGEDPGTLMPPDLRLLSLPKSKDPSRTPPTITFFCSLRSPYTWLAVPRIRQLAQHYGAKLELKFVLPMVMRGLPIPTAKRFYILLDAKREATRLGLPFGDVADPVGRPAERGLAVLHHAIQRGCGEAFLESFLRGVFAEGIDAGGSRGLARIATRAGVDSHTVDLALADDTWRRAAEHHRNELLSTGLWGVPSFRVAGLPAYWGQDRLWCLEDDLIRLTT
ncbi:MAG: DsbA family protein [Gammaproteobacteria bacterium]